MTTLRIETAPVFRPLLKPSRYKGCYGGRGSGKSRFFASLMIEDHVANLGLRSVCIREVQRTLKESAKRLLEDELKRNGLGESDGFKITNEEIRTPGGGVIIFQGMQDHTAESIKSLEGFNRAWIEEAQTLSARSLQLLRPTIRAPGSEIWASWNPRRKADAVDALFRGNNLPSDAIVVQANWQDNPWFPAELEQERLDDLRINPDQYGHVWNGDYVSVMIGAYYAKQIALAREERRIGGRIAVDPLLPVRAFWDIGGTSSKSDACAIWIAQFVGREVRVLNYYEAIGQPLSAHVYWLQEQGYTPQNCLCYLPHDGVTHDRVYDVTYESELQRIGYDVTIVENQGKGAAMQRVTALRKLFPALFFDDRCSAGLDALGWYHERRDESRSIGLGPDHNWASHASDAAGMMGVVADDIFSETGRHAPDREAMKPRRNWRTT